MLGTKAGNECVEAADFESALRSFASLSACRCADMDVGCMAMPSRLRACGSEDREHERLGRAMRVFGATELVEDRDELDMAGR